MLKNCRIVLVRPHFPGNLGATARIMRNFGLDQLVLLNPIADRTHIEARAMATKGISILEQARIVTEWEDALQGCGLVFATSSNVWGLTRSTSYGRPDEQLRKIAIASQSSPCALVFGPEPHGLSTEEIHRCHGIIRILADPEYPALNLAQTVAICVYELHRQWMHQQDTAMEDTQPIAAYEDQERMFHVLREALEQVHFLWGVKADSLFQGIRHLITRAKPSPNEVKILFGLARQLQWIVEHGAKDEG